MGNRQHLGIGLVAVAVVLGAAGFMLWPLGFVDDDAGDAGRDAGRDSGREAPAILVGAATDSTRSSVPSPPDRAIDQLLRRARGTDPDDGHEALRALKKMAEAGEVPLERLVAWALLTDAELGATPELAPWARAALKSRRPESLAHLPTIHEAALGAGERKQGAVALTLRDLGEIRPEDVPLVGRLFSHESTGYWIKRTLVAVMDGLGPDAAPLAPQLMTFVCAVLKERAIAAREAEKAGIHVSWDHVEYDVERLLGAMGETVVPLLERGLREGVVGRDPAEMFSWDPSGIYSSALAAAGEEGRRVLIGMLSDPDRTLRQDAASALGEVEGGHVVVQEALLAALEDPDPWVRKAAAEALGRHERVVIPALLRALADENADVRRAAAGSLTKLDVEPADALPRLLGMVQGDDRFASLTAAESIASFGEAARPALPALIQGLDTEDTWFQDRFAAVVGRVAAHDPEALSRAWREASPAVQRGLLRSLDHMHEVPESLLGELQAALDHEDLGVRVRAAVLLIDRGRGDVMPALEAGFAGRDGLIRMIATEGLSRMGARSLTLLPVMLERLEGGEGLYYSPSSSYRSEESALDEAVRHLGRFDLPRMFDLLDHDDFNLSYAAEQAIEAAGLEGFAFLSSRWSTAGRPKKLKMLDIAEGAFSKNEAADAAARRDAARALARLGLADGDPVVRLDAVGALRRDQDSLAEILPLLVDLLDVRDADAARGAAYRLQDLGPRAAPVQADLEARRDHPDAQVRKHLRRALERIEDER